MPAGQDRPLADRRLLMFVDDIYEDWSFGIRSCEWSRPALRSWWLHLRRTENITASTAMPNPIEWQRP